MSTITAILPDFLVIGAGKSGTTSLDIYLNAHPEIFMSQRKDPGYFASEQYNITDDMLPESKAYYQQFISTEVEYSELFKEAQAEQRIGETSTIYLYSESGYKLIKDRIPDVKLIAILRQPAERLFSRYLHLAREGVLPSDEFEELFDRSSIWWHRPDLIPEGYYYKHLSRFYENFPKENLKVLLYDELVLNPSELMKEIFRFLEVDEDFVPSTDVTYNQSGIIKSNFVNKIVGYNNPIFRTLKNYFPNGYNALKENQSALKALNKIRSKNLEKPRLTKELNSRIMNEIYSDDQRNLEKLIGRDLSHWQP